MYTSFAIGMLLALLAACGPRVSPEGPGTEPLVGSVEPVPADLSLRSPAQEVLIGEMCPQAAAGRAAVKPLFLYSVRWSDAAADVEARVAQRSARQFQVLSWDGHRAGIFSVAGLADVGLEDQVAAGAYAGTSPCLRTEGEPGAAPKEEPACVSAQAHCGVAVAMLERGGAPFEEDPDPESIAVSGACVVEGKLLVDIDDDGAAEAFSVADFVSPVRAPSEEVLATEVGASRCRPSFSVRHAVPPGDPKHWRGLDVLAVLDVNGDGRRELVLSYHYAARRTWAVYSATGSAGRLDLVGESEPWPTR
ncbi:MAG: hypothetical protein Tsb0020_08210 [Haliangiales bacterium]